MSLTTDLMQYVQTVDYMVVTCRFVDKDFKLQKRVLDFCDVPAPYTGVAIVDALQTCLADLDVERKVWTITVANSFYRDVDVRILKETLSFQGRLPFAGYVFHVRCCAHIVNTLVQTGLKEIGPIIENVINNVKYIAASESRVNMFWDVAK
ncbi:unnamed protein product [Linum trigynum]|uniref:Transposase n=1 Tax=Linum trigynum TaxID=586398 RepID=A0AAV2CWS9_9ROSI